MNKEESKLEFVDINYDMLKNQLKEFKNKNEVYKVKVLEKLIQKLDEKKDEGKGLTKEVTEEVVNKLIDDNLLKLKELRKELKNLKKENKFLSQYSERDMEEEATTEFTTVLY